MNPKPCDFDGRAVTFRHAGSNSTAKLMFRSFDSAAHPEHIDLSIPRELFWDKATKTLYYKDSDGDIWRCAFERATDVMAREVRVEGSAKTPEERAELEAGFRKRIP